MGVSKREQAGLPARADVPYLAALLALGCMLYLPQLFSGLTAMDAPEKMDVSSQWHPGYSFIGESIDKGLFPLWNPERYSGMPWLAYSHAGCLYPLNVSLFTLFDFFDASTLAHLFHFLVAAIGLYIFLRDLDASPLASFLAAAVFPCSGLFFFLQSQLSNHATMCWAPLLLFALRRLVLHRGAAAFVGAGVVSALMVYGGDLEGFAYTLVFIFLFILFHIRAGMPGGALGSLSLAILGLALGFLLSTALAVVLFEYLSHSVRSSGSPFHLQFSGIFERWYLHLQYLFFPWARFKGLHPNVAYNNGLAPFYMGVLPLLGAAFSIRLYRRDPRIRAFLNAAAAMLVFVLVRKMSLFEPVFSRLPVLGQLATVERSIELVQLSALVCAACALDRFIKDLSRGRLLALSALVFSFGAGNLFLGPWQTGAPARYIAGASMVLFGTVWIAAALKGGPLRGLVTAGVAAAVLLDSYLLALFCVPRTSPEEFSLHGPVKELVRRAGPGYRFWAFQELGPGMEEPELAGAIIASGRMDSPYGFMRLPMHRYFEFLHLIDPGVTRDWRGVLLKWPGREKNYFAADLFNPAFLDSDNLHLLNLLAVRYLFSRGLSIRFSSPFPLMNEGALVRGDWLAWPEEKGLEAEFFRVDSRRALRTELPYRIELGSFVYPGAELAFELMVMQAGMEGVTVQVSGRGQGAPRFVPVYARSMPGPEKGREYGIRVPLDELAGAEADIRLEILSQGGKGEAAVKDARFIRPDMPFKRIIAGPVDAYVNTGALPRSFAVSRGLSLDRHNLKRIMKDPARFDPERTLLFLEGDVPGGLLELAEKGARPGRAGSVKIREHGFQEVRLDARMYSPGFLFLSDSYYPGWRARVDGAPSRVFRADMVFRALFLGRGDHSVVMRYEPVSFKCGMWLALSSLVCCLPVLSAASFRAKTFLTQRRKDAKIK